MNKAFARILAATAISLILATPGITVFAQENAGPTSNRPSAAPWQMKRERNPVIQRCLNGLERIKAALEKTPHDFQGHRTAAIQSVDQAIQHLRLALEVGKQ